MLQLLSTPTSTLPASPPTSPPLQHNAALPAPSTTGTTTTTFADGPATPAWRPYHSHLARLVMTLPGLGGNDAVKKPRRMSFSFGADAPVSGDKEYVLEGTVSVYADKMEFLVSTDANPPFVRPAGSNKPATGAAARPPMSPPSSPKARKQRLSFVNSLPGAAMFFAKEKEQQAAGGDHDDSALDLEEHPELGPGGVRQLRMKSFDRGAHTAAPAAETMPVEAEAQPQPEERAHAEGDESKWPLFVNGAPLAQISFPLEQLSLSSVDVTLSRALSSEKATSALAGTLNRSPATLAVHVPATEDASATAAVVGKDVYDGPVMLRVEFPSAFSGDTEAKTLHQIMELALERLGKKADAADGDYGLKLTRTISRGLGGGGRRKSSFGESTHAEGDERAKAEYYDAMKSH